MNIVMMGVQGSGKGTQSKMIAEHLKLPHISTGDLFRANLSQGTDLGRKAKAFMDRGELVPDTIVIDMVQDRLTHADAKSGYILDGFPRNGVQLAALEFIRPVEHAVLLDLDDATAIKRLTGRSECPKCAIIYGAANRPPKIKGKCDKCGGPLKERGDDKDVQAVKTRLAVYHQEIGVMVSYYEWKKVLRRIDAAGTVDEIFGKIVASLKR
ncbi:MAG: adenylate kinase family protein [Phycisphaerae bacterium]